MGNIPLSWYADCIHIGYDRDGNQIMKKPKKDEIDLFLEKVEDPDYWFVLLRIFFLNWSSFLRNSMTDTSAQ